MMLTDKLEQSEGLQYALEVVSHTTDKELLVRWFCELNIYQTPKEFAVMLDSDDCGKVMDKIPVTNYEWLKYWNMHCLSLQRCMTEEEFDNWWWNKRD